MYRSISKSLFIYLIFSGCNVTKSWEQLSALYRINTPRFNSGTSQIETMHAAHALVDVV
jgi:hypothetical protein